MLGRLANSGLANKALSMGQGLASSPTAANLGQQFANSGFANQLKEAALARATNAINTVGMPTVPAVGAPAVSEGPTPITLQQAEVVETLVRAGMPLKDAVAAATGIPATEAASGPSIADAIAEVAAEQRGGRRKKKTKRARRKSKRTKTSRS